MRIRFLSGSKFKASQISFIKSNTVERAITLSSYRPFCVPYRFRNLISSPNCIQKTRQIAIALSAKRQR